MHTEELLWTILAFLLVISISMALLNSRRYNDVPAVPGRLPFIGNALNIDMQRPHLVLTDLSQSLGPIFRFKLYRDEIIVLNDYDTISEALVSNGSAVSGRPPMKRTSISDRSSHSIVWQTYTPKLVFLRKEVLKGLKMFGMGLEKLEEKCILEINILLDLISEEKGEPINPMDLMYDSVSCLMFNLIVGGVERPSLHNLKKLKDINTLFNSTFGCGRARHMDFLPWSRLFQKDCQSELYEALRLRDEFWESNLRQIKTTNEGVISKLMALVASGDWEQFDLSENTTKEVFTNLILAGTDTTATTLTCFLLFLLHHPDVQDKLYAELCTVVGASRLASLSDKHCMPYTEAMLLELLRILAHVPLAIPHYTIEDTTIQGKHVPAETTVYINLWAMLHDEKIWEKPWDFRPDRFLDKDGHLIPPSHPTRRRMMAFGAGRRVCLGENFAKNRLFLYVTALVQKFRFCAAPDEPLLDWDPRTFEMGIVLHPKEFKLVAVQRN